VSITRRVQLQTRYRRLPTPRLGALATGSHYRLERQTFELPLRRLAPAVGLHRQKQHKREGHHPLVLYAAGHGRGAGDAAHKDLGVIEI
jgi:hypothetical protein